MFRVKDPQITLVGLIKGVGDPAKGREMVVVSVPPLLSPVLVERTLLVNLPDAEQLKLARNPVLDEHGRSVYTEIRCYLKLKVFDGKPVVIDPNVRHRDPQEVLIGLVKPVENSNHSIIVVEFPAEKLVEDCVSTDDCSPADRYCATTLIVNIPSVEDEAVDCYLKYRIIDSFEMEKRQSRAIGSVGSDRRANSASHHYHNHSTV